MIGLSLSNGNPIRKYHNLFGCVKIYEPLSRSQKVFFLQLIHWTTTIFGIHFTNAIGLLLRCNAKTTQIDRYVINDYQKAESHIKSIPIRWCSVLRSNQPAANQLSMSMFYYMRSFLVWSYFEHLLL